MLLNLPATPVPFQTIWSSNAWLVYMWHTVYLSMNTDPCDFSWLSSGPWGRCEDSVSAGTTAVSCYMFCNLYVRYPIIWCYTAGVASLMCCKWHFRRQLREEFSINAIHYSVIILFITSVCCSEDTDYSAQS